MKTLRIGPLFIPLMRQVYASIDDAADEAEAAHRSPIMVGVGRQGIEEARP